MNLPEENYYSIYESREKKQDIITADDNSAEDKPGLYTNISTDSVINIGTDQHPEKRDSRRITIKRWQFIAMVVLTCFVTVGVMFSILYSSFKISGMESNYQNYQQENRFMQSQLHQLLQAVNMIETVLKDQEVL